jgi:hypothetical protein
VDPHELHQRMVAAGFPELVEVKLPAVTYARINDMINSVLTTPVPAWVMSMYAAQDGLTAGYYHCRYVARTEHAVDEIARRIYADAPDDIAATTMSFRAPQLTYEYQAFIFALRRSFDYLAGALTRGIGCDFVSSFTQVPRPLKNASAANRPSAEAIMRGCLAAIGAFPEVFDPQKGQSIRDRIAHHTSLPGGQFTVSFRPGQPVAVELEGGGEKLPLLADPAHPAGRLSELLLDRLRRFEDTFVDLAGHIPAIAEASKREQQSPPP